MDYKTLIGKELLSKINFYFGDELIFERLKYYKVEDVYGQYDINVKITNEKTWFVFKIDAKMKSIDLWNCFYKKEEELEAFRKEKLEKIYK